MSSTTSFCVFFSRSCCFFRRILSTVLRYSITMFGHVARDVLLAIKGQFRCCKLDQRVRDTVSRLSLRRRGCRAGEHCRRRRLAAVTSSACRNHGDTVANLPSLVSCFMVNVKCAFRLYSAFNAAAHRVSSVLGCSTLARSATSAPTINTGLATGN